MHAHSAPLLQRQLRRAQATFTCVRPIMHSDSSTTHLRRFQLDPLLLSLSSFHECSYSSSLPHPPLQPTPAVPSSIPQRYSQAGCSTVAIVKSNQNADSHVDDQKHSESVCVLNFETPVVNTTVLPSSLRGREEFRGPSQDGVLLATHCVLLPT